MNRTSIYTLLLASFLLIAPWSFTAAQNGAPEPDPEETSFLNRTPEEYRDAYLKAINEATIDAIVCQQLVQEWRSEGQNFSDEDFTKKLELKETRLERQRRVDYWVQERAKAAEAAKTINFSKFGPIVGGVLCVLIVVLILGARGNKKDAAAQVGGSEKK